MNATVWVKITLYCMLTITCNVQCMTRAPLGRLKQVVDSYKAIKQEPLVQFATTNMPFDEFLDKSKKLLWIKNYPIIKTSNSLSCHINSLEELRSQLRFMKETDFKEDSCYLSEIDTSMQIDTLMQDINETHIALTQKMRLLEKDPDLAIDQVKKEIVDSLKNFGGITLGITLLIATFPVGPLLCMAAGASVPKPGKDC